MCAACNVSLGHVGSCEYSRNDVGPELFEVAETNLALTALLVVTVTA